MAILNFSINLPIITITLDKIEEYLLLYNRIQVFRSADNVTYSEITDNDYSAAQIDGTISGPFNLNNKTLTIQKENILYTINFTLDGLDTLSVIKEINTIAKFPLAFNKGNKVCIKSNITGTGSWLIIGGNAATILGLSTTKVYGKGRRPDLTDPTIIYNFYDLSDIAKDCWYKIRFFNSKTERVSDYSSTVQATPPPILNDSNFVVGSLQLSDITGNPMRNIKIICTPIIYRTISNVSILNFQKQTIKETDQFGKVEIKLLKGATIRIDIEGTDLGRELLIPNTDFNILTLISNTTDPMSIKQAPNYPIVIS